MGVGSDDSWLDCSLCASYMSSCHYHLHHPCCNKNKKSRIVALLYRLTWAGKWPLQECGCCCCCYNYQKKNWNYEVTHSCSRALTSLDHWSTWCWGICSVFNLYHQFECVCFVHLGLQQTPCSCIGSSSFLPSDTCADSDVIILTPYHYLYTMSRAQYILKERAEFAEKNHKKNIKHDASPRTKLKCTYSHANTLF